MFTTNVFSTSTVRHTNPSTSKLHAFFELAKKISLPTGSSSNSQEHEIKVKACLEIAGFVLSEQGLKTKDQRKRYKEGDRNNLGINPGEFVEQPFGKNNNPDFIVHDEECGVVAIEAKSSKQYAPTYNSGYPSPDTVYVFTSTGKALDVNSQTLLFTGSDVLDEEQRRLINLHVEDADNHSAHTNSHLVKIGKRRTKVYARIQLDISDNYFADPDFGSFFVSKYGTETRALV